MLQSVGSRRLYLGIRWHLHCLWRNHIEGHTGISVLYSPELLILEAHCKESLDMSACFPQALEGFTSVGFAPPTGNKALSRPKLGIAHE